VLVPRTPWRIAVWRPGLPTEAGVAPRLCLPGAAATHCTRRRPDGDTAWRFDWLDSGASDNCLAGHRPDTLRQLAAVAALVQTETGRFEIVLQAPSHEAPLVRRFAERYPFAVAQLVIEPTPGELDEPVQCDRRDLRGTAA
jgi:hypothetical protein